MVKKRLRTTSVVVFLFISPMESGRNKFKSIWSTTGPDARTSGACAVPLPTLRWRTSWFYVLREKGIYCLKTSNPAGADDEEIIVYLPSSTRTGNGGNRRSRKTESVSASIANEDISVRAFDVMHQWDPLLSELCISMFLNVFFRIQALDTFISVPL